MNIVDFLSDRGSAAAFVAHPLHVGLNASHAGALVIAYTLAFPIDRNREEERSAGLRTFPLVAVASCGVIRAAESLTADSPEAMARIVKGLITGMGFIAPLKRLTGTIDEELRSAAGHMERRANAGRADSA